MLSQKARVRIHPTLTRRSLVLSPKLSSAVPRKCASRATIAFLKDGRDLAMPMATKRKCRADRVLAAEKQQTLSSAVGISSALTAEQEPAGAAT